MIIPKGSISESMNISAISDTLTIIFIMPKVIPMRYSKLNFCIMIMPVTAKMIDRKRVISISALIMKMQSFLRQPQRKNIPNVRICLIADIADEPVEPSKTMITAVIIIGNIL